MKDQRLYSTNENEIYTLNKYASSYFAFINGVMPLALIEDDKKSNATKYLFTQPRCCKRSMFVFISTQRLYGRTS